MARWVSPTLPFVFFRWIFPPVRKQTYDRKCAKEREGYGYLCVIHGLVLGPADVQNFEAYMKAHCNVRVQYLETYKTCPSVKDGVPVPETGGRSDVIFAIHRDDYSNL